MGVPQIKLSEKLPEGYSGTNLFNLIGNLVKFNILNRAQKGESAEGSAFSSYSESYEKVREKKGLPTNPDLFFSGRMLSALQYEGQETQVKLYFLNTADAQGTSNAAKAYYNDQLRPFFSLSKKDIDDVSKLVSEELQRALDELEG